MNDDEYEVPIQRRLLKPTLLITFFSMIGIIVSFFIQIVLAAKFGAKMEMDAYLAAVVVPQFMTMVLLGALNVTFIPIFIKYETQKNKTEAWKIASIFTNFTFLILFVVSFLGCVFTPQLISVTAPGFKGESFSLTVSLVRILLPSIIFGGLNSLLSSIYYAHHQFFKPSVAPVINSLVILLSVIALQPLWGIKSIAFGVLVGSFVNFFILFPIFLKNKRYKFSFDFSNQGVIEIIKVMSPLVIAGLFYRATTLIQRMIASTLPEGSISYLGYATKIVTILGMITTSGISVTIFPAMARSWAENDLAKVREYFAKGIRIIMLITFPVAAIFVVLRVPIIQVIFERGKFTHDITVAVANVLMILMVYFVCAGLGNVLGKGFYISQRTKLLAILGIIETVIYFGYSYALAKRFSYIGLAMATSMYYFFPIVINTFIMRRIYNGINGKDTFSGFIKILIAAVGSGCSVYLAFVFFSEKQNLLVSAGTSGILGLLVYISLIFYVFKVKEATTFKKEVFNKLRNIACWSSAVH